MQLTREQEVISRKNNRKAWKAFGYKYDSHRGMVLHHIDETLRCSDIERYIQWNVEDLQVMTNAEHNTLHHKGKSVNKGIPKTELHKQHLKDNHADFSLGNHPMAKPIKCIETGEIYSCTAEAVKENKNVSKSGICGVLKGRHHTHGGYHWEYVNDNE